MTRSLSNLIKAYSIKYNENEKKTIDSNEKANEFQKMFLEKLGFSSVHTGTVNMSEEFTAATLEGDSFVAGIHPVALVEELDESQNPTVDLEEEHKKVKERMEEEAKQILEDAEQKAKEILENANREATYLLEKAKEDGYKAGNDAAMLELHQLKQELEDEEKKLKLEYESLMRDLEPKFVELLISFIKKLTNYAIEEKEEIILYLIEQAFGSCEASNSYIVKVSKEDYELVNSHKTELLWQLKEGVELEIVEDLLLTKTQCLIETDSRVIDCSLDIQLKNLISDLKLLAGSSSQEVQGDSYD